MTKRVLEWVNRQRVKAGVEPLAEMPKGKPGCLHTCPIASAFIPVIDTVPGAGRVIVDGTVVDFEGWVDGEYRILKQLKCPAYVEEAVKRFDTGKYRDLVDVDNMSPDELAELSLV